jgi:hypothetical protein
MEMCIDSDNYESIDISDDETDVYYDLTRKSITSNTINTSHEIITSMKEDSMHNYDKFLMSSTEYKEIFDSAKEVIYMSDDDMDKDITIIEHNGKNKKENADVREWLESIGIHDNIDNSMMHSYISTMHLESHIEHVKKSLVFTMPNMVKEFILIMVLHMYLGTNNALFNVIQIDGIISSLIWGIDSMGIAEYNFLSHNFMKNSRLITIDRYIYYMLMISGYYVTDYLLWYNFSTEMRLITSIMVCPTIMGYVYMNKTYSKVRQFLYNGYNELIKKIVCKQLSKILNLFIDNVLNIEINIKYTDLTPHYSEFDFYVINQFIVTFIIALIFNRLDRGSLKIPLMIYKNFYMKDGKYNIRDDRQYLTQIIKDKNWGKFIDVYTLNRMIRIIIDEDNDDADFTETLRALMKRFVYRFNRIMFCWSVMSVTNNTQLGFAGFLLFTLNAKKPMRYILSTILFILLSAYTTDKILLLIACELFYDIAYSRVINDVIKDIYNSVTNGTIYLYGKSRTESLVVTVMLTTMSCITNNYLYMLIPTMITSSTMLYGMYINNGYEDIKVDLLEDALESDIVDCESHKINENIGFLTKLKNNDTLKIIEKIMLKNRKIGMVVLNRFAFYFALMILGYISGFALMHVVLMPIILQIIVDILFS